MFPDLVPQSIRRILRRLFAIDKITKYDRQDLPKPFYNRFGMWRFLDLPVTQEKVYKILYGSGWMTTREIAEELHNSDFVGADQIGEARHALYRLQGRGWVIANKKPGRITSWKWEPDIGLISKEIPV